MLGILSTEREEVPGTVFLGSTSEVTDTTPNLKRHPKRPDLVLQPQPSDNVNDPLNWSPWRKEAFYVSILLGTIVVGVIGPSVIPSPPQLIPEFQINVKQFTALIGDLVLTYGIASYFVVCLSDTLGRRPLSLISHVVMIWGLIWGATAQTYEQLVGARVVQGFAMGVYGCLASSFINDVFFLHEQGTRTAIWQFSFNGAIAVTPILAGQICENNGWRYLFWVLLPFEALAFVFAIFFQPESVYERQPKETTNTMIIPAELPEEEKDLSLPMTIPVDETSSTSVPIRPREIFMDSTTTSNSWLTRLKPWSGRHGRKRSIFSLLTRPFLLVLSPGVLYATLYFTLTFSWFPILGSLYSAVYSSPPYNFNSASVGYITGVSPFIGVMLALITSGPILDRGAAILSKHNDGLFEPEFRLILNIPTFICFAIGAFGWSWSISQGQHYITTAIYLAFLTAGAAFGTIGSLSYGIALFPSRAGEAFGIIMLIKAIYAWSATLYVTTWFKSVGPWHWGCTLGGITLFLIALGLPLWVWGKRGRSWIVTIDKIRWIFIDE